MRRGLIGRSHELRRARLLLEEHGVVVFTGPSGVGKTALCDTLAEEWASHGGHVHELRGTQGLSEVPFGALTLALRVDPGESDGKTLGRVVALLTDAETDPMVIVDDAHLLDSQSAGLVAGLAQTRGVAFAMAITSGESVSADITSVWARWPECLLRVQPLDREGVGDLVTALLGHRPNDEEIKEIATTSLGYPLYVTALAYELEGSREGRLDSMTVRDSDRLTSLMERRLARLDRDERRLFDVIAFAESTSVSIARAAGRPETLERLVETDLVKVAGGRVQVSHPLLGSVSRGTLTFDGRRACARSLLESLSSETDPGDVATMVRKAMAVGVVPHVDRLRTAAEIALGWGDYTGAAAITSLAPEDPVLLVLRAKAARFLGETPGTDIPVGLDQAALAEYLSGTSQGIAYGERRFTDAINFLKRGMDSITEDTLRDRLAMELLVLSGLVGDIDALLGAARTVSPGADPSTRLLALSATQLAEALTLSTARSDETYRLGREVAEADGVDSFLIEQLEMSRVMVELAEGHFDVARRRADAFRERTLIGSWLTIEAVLADGWLPTEEALAIADAAVEALEVFDPLANLAQARIVADLRRAQRGVGLVHDQTDQQHEPGVMEIDRIMNQRVDAWLAWHDDDPTAGKRLAEVGRDAILMGHRFWGLCALIDAVRLGFGEGVVADIEHLVITRGPGLAVLASRHARARSGGELFAAARAWWEAGAPTYGVEAAIRAADPGDPYGCLAAHLMHAVGARPLVGDVGEVPNPISDRQLEIVARALAGESNDEIAGGLFISRRTAENHLHRMYTMMGFSGGRDELIDRFGWIFTPPGASGPAPIEYPDVGD